MCHRSNAPFYLLTLGAFLFLTLPRMAQPGMFVDGVTYASISRNLAAGIGTFWSPSYTATLYPVFHEHPPLGFALEGLAFAVLGDHLASERVYALTMGALTGVLIVLTWRAAVREHSFDWLPVVMWLLPSTVTWGIVNNLLETTQAVFTTFAVLAIVRGLQSDRRWLGWGFIAGTAVVAGTLSKGPTGLFPLASPFVAAVVFPGCRAASVRIGAAMIATVGVFAAALFAGEGSKIALAAYLDHQVLASLTGARGGGRWTPLAGHLTNGVILRMALLTLVAWLVARWRGVTDVVRRGSHLVRSSLFFLAMGLCGSVPTAASARIMGHYLVPSIPMYALGFAVLVLQLLRPALTSWQSTGSTARKVAIAGGSLLLVLTAALPALGITMEPRDVQWMSEYEALTPHMPRAVTAGTCAAVEGDWGSHAYLQRFFRISLDVDSRRLHRYFIQFRDRPCEAPADCQITASTARLALLDCDVAPR